MTNPTIRCSVAGGIILVIAGFIPSDLLPGDVVVVGANKDNTLFENETGIVSNGAGSFIFAGQNSFGGGFLNRRGLVQFDIAESLPAGSIINSVELEMNLSQSQSTSTTNISLHRVLQDWGEGTSNSDGNAGGGQGAASTTGDATWIHTSYPDSTWNTPGGDFDATVSSTVAVGPALGSYTWSSTPELVAEVQFWLDNSAQNFGWLLLGQEVAGSAKRFDSHENTGGTGPQLRIDFTPPPPMPIAVGNVRAKTELIAADMVAPVLLTHANDGTDRLFIVDQAGVVRLIKNGTLLTTPYLDASGLIVNPLGGIIPPFQDPFADFDERGLLGLAFHPDFAQTGMPGFGKLYTYTSEPLNGPADFTVALPAGDTFDHQAVIREWTVDPTLDEIIGDPNVISRKLMSIDEPQFNHNAGHVAFGPDRMLYLSLGDGGGGGDDEPGHGEMGNGQDASNVLGTILRIEPLGNNSGNGQYGVPADNPFVANPKKVDEIYAYGLRNPYRFCFDKDLLVVADVGQSNIEEVDIVNSGDNLGWRLKEGSFFYDHVSNTISTTPFGQLPPNFNPVDPVLQYDHSEGISITGGFVYRGTEFPDLVGKYVFGDFSNAGFFVPGGRLFYGDLTTGEILEFDLGCELGLYVKGFGQDAEGELYVLGGTNLGPFRDANGRGYGSVHRLSPRTETTANSVTVIRGIQTGGSLDDICTSNNVDYSIQRNPIQATGVVEVEVKTVTSVGTPTKLEFTLEAAGFFRSTLIQSIEFFDYDAGAFVEVDSRDTSRFSDSITVAAGTGDLTRFVEEGTGCVLTRILYTSVARRQAFSAAIDQVFWIIE